MKDNNFDERFALGGVEVENIIQDEHLIRYELAKTLVKNKNVVDIASGTGYGTSILSNSGAKKVTGVDVSKEAVKLASEKFQNENLEYTLGDAENLSFEDNSCDLVVSFETIEHLKNPNEFLSEVKRILVEGGQLLISTPNIEVSGNTNPYHLKEYTEDEFENILKKYFKIVKLMKQENGMASMIKVSDNLETSVIMSDSLKPSYFVAICSDNSLPIIDKNFLSLNYKALANIYNNPGFKLMNVVYTVLIKIPGVKKLFGRLRK